MSMDQLRRDGITGPHELADKSGLDAACEVVLALKALQRQQNRVARITGLPNEGPNPLIDRHMDVDVLRNLYFDDNLQAALAEYFGTGLFIWRTNFFVKSEGAGQNKWHHDRHFENGNAPLNLFDTSNHYSITIALTDIDLDAGRIEYVRGSHLPIEGWDRDIPRHINEVPEVVQDRVTPLPMKRGQFVLFHGQLLHRSRAFDHGEGRISMAARVLRTGTQIPEYGIPNPAGGAHSAAEPVAEFRRSGILPLN